MKFFLGLLQRRPQGPLEALTAFHGLPRHPAAPKNLSPLHKNASEALKAMGHWGAWVA